MESKFYFWVIGGGEMQVPIISELRAMGVNVVCSDLSKSCVCANLADYFFQIDIFDVESHIKKATEFSVDHKIVGVLAAGIDAPITMACLAESLGLPGVSPSIARMVHNKAEFRRRLGELGFPIPRFIDFGREDLPRIAQIAAEIGYPLIVKNTDSSASRGTKIFQNPDEEGLVEIATEAIKVSKSKRALIESLWVGSEQTIETLFDVDGNFYPCFITDREFDKRMGYALETSLRHPTILSKDTQLEMYHMAKDVADAIGIKIGAAKYDCILTDEGPRIIEMTVRLSGGFDCQYLVPSATGKNVIRAAILTAMGKKFDPDLLTSKFDRVAISRSLWPNPGRIKDIHGFDEALKIPGVEKIIFRKNIGDIIEPYVDCAKRTCFIIISGDSQEDVEKTFKEVERTLIFEIEQ